MKLSTQTIITLLGLVVVILVQLTSGARWAGQIETKVESLSRRVAIIELHVSEN